VYLCCLLQHCVTNKPNPAQAARWVKLRVCCAEASAWWGLPGRAGVLLSWGGRTEWTVGPVDGNSLSRYCTTHYSDQRRKTSYTESITYSFLRGSIWRIWWWSLFYWCQGDHFPPTQRWQYLWTTHWDRPGGDGKDSGILIFVSGMKGLQS